MDQKIIHSGTILSGAVAIAMGVLVSPVAIGLASSYPHELWWLGALLCGGCFLMIYGGIQSIKTARAKEKMAQAERARITTELDQKQAVADFSAGLPISPQTPAAVPLRPEVLAHWIFSESEWKQFMRLEKGRRLESSIYEALGFTILGTVVIMLSREAVFYVAVSISALIGVIISSLRYWLTLKSLGNVLPENQVIITRQSVFINDKLNPYRSDNLWLDKLEFKAGIPPVLEFTYAWHNRKKKKMFDELRVPVPPRAEAEARALIQKILNPHV